MCETLWRPKMTPDELFECISQAMMSALDRDASSGKLSFYENKLWIPEPYSLARKKARVRVLKGYQAPTFFSITHSFGPVAWVFTDLGPVYKISSIHLISCRISNWTVVVGVRRSQGRNCMCPLFVYTWPVPRLVLIKSTLIRHP